MRIGKFLFYVAVLTMVTCDGKPVFPQVQAQPELKTPPPTPIAEKKEELGKPSWDPQWDFIVEEALPPDLLSPAVARNVKQLCPRFKFMDDVDKREFWAYLFQALAGAEAGLVPTTNVQHTEPEFAVEDTVTKRMVRSEGLLQLTYMDAVRYGCDFDWEKDKQLAEKDPAKTILQPENNLLCGIRIMENQLVSRRKPLVSSASYWSTLRPGTLSYRVFYKQMANIPAVCRVDPPRDTQVSESASLRPAAAASFVAGTN